MPALELHGAMYRMRLYSGRPSNQGCATAVIPQTKRGTEEPTGHHLPELASVFAGASTSTHLCEPAPDGGPALPEGRQMPASSGAGGSAVSGLLTSTGASTSSGGGAKLRTAAEIRAAYGRPALSSDHPRGAKTAADVAGVMAENRAALAERGEKLQQLQAKGADLEESAAAFAALAKQLAEKEKQTGRWFGLR